jgi:hypothetical protein
MRFLGTRIWAEAFSFFFRHPIALAPIAPLLMIPFLSDALSTALIGQENRDGHLQPAVALQQALRALPALLRLKLFYFARAFAWALIPIYGVIRDIDERLAWGMSSNVIMLESEMDFAKARTRCEGLVAEFRGECIRVLFTMPVTLLVPIAVALAVGRSPWVFWAVIGAVIWIILPASAAANTYLYLWIREQEDTRVSANTVASRASVPAPVGPQPI